MRVQILMTSTFNRIMFRKLVFLTFSIEYHKTRLHTDLLMLIAIKVVFFFRNAPVLNVNCLLKYSLSLSLSFSLSLSLSLSLSACVLVM